MLPEHRFIDAIVKIPCKGTMKGLHGILVEWLLSFAKGVLSMARSERTGGGLT